MRGTGEEGTCTVTIDMRKPKPAGAINEEANYANASDLLTLVAVLTELCGPECEVFFDFGQVSITNVSLSGFAKRARAEEHVKVVQQ